MTPLEKAGFKVGDKFIYIGSTNSYAINGSTCTWETDNGTESPLAKTSICSCFISIFNAGEITQDTIRNPSTGLPMSCGPYREVEIPRIHDRRFRPQTGDIFKHRYSDAYYVCCRKVLVCVRGATVGNIWTDLGTFNGQEHDFDYIGNANDTTNLITVNVRK